MKTNHVNKFNFLASAAASEKEREVHAKNVKSETQNIQEKKSIPLKRTAVTKIKKT